MLEKLKEPLVKVELAVSFFFFPVLRELGNHSRNLTSLKCYRENLKDKFFSAFGEWHVCSLLLISSPYFVIGYIIETFSLE